jgi:hypothetical protein
VRAVSCGVRALFAILAAVHPAPGIASDGDLEVKSVVVGGGIRLYYVEQGSGPALLFIHGSLSDYTCTSTRSRACGGARGTPGRLAPPTPLR